MKTTICTAKIILNRLREADLAVPQLVHRTEIRIKQVLADLDWLFDNGLVFKRNYMMDDGAKMVIYGIVAKRDLTPFSKALLRL